MKNNSHILLQQYSEFLAKVEYLHRYTGFRLASLCVCYALNVLLCTMGIIAEYCVNDKKTLVSCRIAGFYSQRLLLCSENRFKGMPLATQKLLAADRGKTLDQQVP